MDDLAVGEVYHVFSRGVEKRDIFLDDGDRKRFVALLAHCLSVGPSKSYSVYGKGLRQKKVKTGEGLVDIVAYCLMSNHFHLLLHENIEGGISLFMKRVLTSYGKYFNVRYDRSGSLFLHPFKAVLVEQDEQLLHVSRYIHLNPWQAKMIDDPLGYSWSSIVHYVGRGSDIPPVHKELIRSMMTDREYVSFIMDTVDYEKSLQNEDRALIDYGD